MCFALNVLSGGALAQTSAPPQNFEPQVGQEGKDVVWVPTPQALVDRMLDMAKVTPKDYVIDLGSGDGRTVITAAKRGVTAHGHRIQSRHGGAVASATPAKDGVGDKAHLRAGRHLQDRFQQGDRRHAVPAVRLNLQLRPTLLDMKPGTRVVSNTFDMGDWEPDETVGAAAIAPASAAPCCGSCPPRWAAPGRWARTN